MGFVELGGLAGSISLPQNQLPVSALLLVSYSTKYPSSYLRKGESDCCRNTLTLFRAQSVQKQLGHVASNYGIVI
jgi:hypothetical protein